MAKKKKKPIIVMRHGVNDYNTNDVAVIMEKHGAEVFCICRATDKEKGTHMVFARCDSGKKLKKIDREIYGDEYVNDEFYHNAYFD